MTNTQKTLTWYEEIIMEIDQINEVTEVFQNLLNKFPNEFKTSVSVEEKNGKVNWIVKIDIFERKFDRSDFEEYEFLNDGSEIKSDIYGRPIPTEKLSLEEAIIKNLKSKFKLS